MSKFAMLLCAVALLSCEKNSSPTAPYEPPPRGSGVGLIGGYVTSSKGCVIDARIEVVDGSQAGQVVVQKDCPFGDVYGYTLVNLPLNEQVTIRVSAAGYKSAQLRMYPSERAPQTNFVLADE